MADSAERELKILLKLAADVQQGKTQAIGAIKEVEAQALASSKVTGQALNIGALSPQGRADLAQTLATGKGIGIFANEAKVASAGMATNFGIAGVNIARARQEALVLAREIATGNIRASTMGSLLGSAGTSITIAGIAAFELGHLIQLAADESLQLNKEFAKTTAELDKQIDKWTVLAKGAGSFADVAKIGSEIAPALAAASTRLAEFRATELTLQQKFVDAIAAMWSAIPGQGPRPNQAVLDKAKQDAAGQLRTMLADAKALYDTGKLSAATWEQMKLGDAATGIATLNSEIDKLTSKQGALEKASELLPGASDSDVQRAARAFQALARVNDELKVAISRRDELKDIEEKESKADDQENKRQQHQAINALLREHASILSSIREQQELIRANPFLSADAKEALSLASMSAELLQIGAAIRETEVALSNSALDPVIHERLQAELKKDQFEFDLLKLKISAINAPLTSQLAEWVNSFGTSAHQIAGLIEGTINASLEGTNQLLLDAAFRTGDWKQTLVGVERQVGNLFLTMLEKMALQQAAQLLGITTTTTAQVSSGAAITAAHAPAAAATSISSFGAAALIGEIAAIAAIVAIMAALGGAFKKGGLTGTNQIARVGEEGPEFVFTHRATRNIGAENLYAMMHAAESAPRFGEGGVMRYPGLFPGNDIEPRWLPGANLPDDFFGRTGTGPIVDLGFGERPIFHWPYGGPNQGGYIVQSGIDIYPGDDDVPDVPPVVASNPYGLPVDPGADPGPGLFPRPPGGVTIIPTAGYRPGGYAATPNYLGNFGGNFSLPFFPGWSGLGYGTRPPVEAGSVFTANNPPTYNSSLGIWQQWDPVAQTMIQAPPPTRFDPGFIDLATGLVIAPSSTRDPSGSASGGSAPSSIVNPPSSPTSGTHWDFTQGRYVANNNATGAQFNSQAANALMMWYQSMGGNPNLAQPDVPSTFQSGVWQLDPESGAFTQVGDRSARDPRWVFPSQSESARLGLSFTNNANKYNDWLIAHNPWFYDQIPGGADGARIPGPASRADNILSWLSTGERVIPAERNIMLERAFGFDWDRKLEVAMPRFANGGRVARGAMASTSGAPAEGDVHVYIFDDRRKAQHAYEESPHARKVFRDRLNRYG